MLEESHYYFTRAADVLDLSPTVRKILLAPQRTVKVEIVTEKDGNYYEVKRGKLTVTLTIAADGALTLAYTKKKKDTEDKGACTVKA